MPDYAAKIRDRKLPLIFAYALNDKIIEQSITDEMITQHLRMPTQNKIYYCENRLPSKDPFLGKITMKLHLTCINLYKYIHMHSEKS